MQLLTVHAAKGLEWDLVAVPGTHRLANRSAVAAAVADWLPGVLAAVPA